MRRYMKATEAFYRLRLPYRRGLDWLFSGKLRGRRRGKHWEAEVEHVEMLELEFGYAEEMTLIWIGLDNEQPAWRGRAAKRA